MYPTKVEILSQTYKNMTKNQNVRTKLLIGGHSLVTS